MKDNLTIKALKYISKRNGEYRPVNLKHFLLLNFPEKINMEERYEMRKFIEFLYKSEYIENLSENGLWIIQEAGRKIPKEEIEALVKITAKGFELIRENDKFIINKVSLVLMILFGISTAFLGWNAYFDKQTIENLKSENARLKKELSDLEDGSVHLIKNDNLNYLNPDYQDRYKAVLKNKKP